MNDYQNVTWSNVTVTYLETAQLMNGNDQEFKRMRAESDQRLEKMRAETDQQIKETGQEIKELGRYLGGISHSNGEMAEEYFYNTLKRDKTFVHENFDKISRNLTYRGEDDNLKMECDIFLFNGKSAAMIEVKYNAKPENVDIESLDYRVAKFKILFPEYQNHKIYLGIAAMSFKKGFARELRNTGFATIHQIGKKMVIYDKEVKAF
jgi:predicted AAA+ superfamily ATPase